MRQKIEISGEIFIFLLKCSTIEKMPPAKLKLKQPSMAIFLTKTKEPAFQSSPDDISFENMSKVDREPAPPVSENSLCKPTKRGRCMIVR